jgi:serine/threonine protein kinase
MFTQPHKLSPVFPSFFTFFGVFYVPLHLVVSTTLLWCSARILSLFIILHLGQFNGFCITEAFLAHLQEARNIEDFYQNFKDDPSVKIPLVYRDLSGPQVLVMEWIDGVRCTNPEGIKEAGIDVEAFITIGVSAALRQLLEFGLFHGDPHPGNIFAMRDGRIAYVDFGNVAELSQVISTPCLKHY